MFQQSPCDAGLGLPFKPNEVVLSAGGHGNVLVSLLAHPKSVEPMVQQSLLAQFSGSLFLAPCDMRKRVVEFMNRSFHPNEEFVGRNASGEHIMADSRVSFVPLGVECSAFHLAETVQVGLVPVYVYDVYDVNDDVPWVPYKDIVPVFVHDEVISDSRVRFVPRGMERGQYTWSWCRSTCATML